MFYSWVTFVHVSIFCDPTPAAMDWPNPSATLFWVARWIMPTWPKSVRKHCMDGHNRGSLTRKSQLIEIRTTLLGELVPTLHRKYDRTLVNFITNGVEIDLIRHSPHFAEPIPVGDIINILLNSELNYLHKAAC